MVKVLLICVNHNTQDEFSRFLDSICRAVESRCVSLTFVLADNSDQAASEAFISAAHTRSEKYLAFHYFRNPNVGYLPSVRLALEKLQTDISDFDFFIFSNVDIELEADFFYELGRRRFLDNVGVIGPSIMDMQFGVDVNPKLKTRPSRWKVRANIMLFKSPMAFKLLRLMYQARTKLRDFRRGKKRLLADINHELGAAPVYAVHGSLVILRPKVIDIRRLLRYPLSLFGEEIYIAEMSRRMGVHTVYTPELKVLDFPHASTGSMAINEYLDLNIKALRYLLGIFFDE